MNNFTLDKTHTAKGLAIILMLIHHLFTFQGRIIPPSEYIPTLYFIDLEFFIGRFGKICVSIFLFLSGFGLLESSKKKTTKSIFKRMLNIYLIYWFYFIIFIGIGFLFFKNNTLWDSSEKQFPFSMGSLLTNFLGITHSYNMEWWFYKFYVSLLVIFPIFFKLLKKTPIILFLSSLIIYCITLLPFINIFIMSNSNYYLLTKFIHQFCYWQFSFIIGIYFAEYKIFDRSFFSNLLWKKYIDFIIIILIIIYRNYTHFFEPIITPIFILSSINLISDIKLKPLIILLGKYSLPMWLTHSFLCYYYFQRIIYFPKIGILVLINLILISLVISVIFEFIRLKLFDIIINIPKISKSGNAK